MVTKRLSFLLALFVLAATSCSHEEALQQAPNTERTIIPEFQPDPPPLPPDVAIASLSSVKFIRPDGVKIDLGASPIPLCSKVELTFSAAVTADKLSGAFSFTSHNANVAHAVDINDDGTVAILTPTSCFAPRTEYSLSFKTDPRWGIVGETQSFVSRTPGDYDGDGVPDFCVSAPEAGETVYEFSCFSGADVSGDLGPADAAATIRTENPQNELTTLIKMIGDINANGYEDIIIGSYGHNDKRGRAYIFDGSVVASKQNISQGDALAVLSGPASNSEFGKSAAGVGDVDKDGYADIGIGSPRRNSSKGTVFLFSGKKLAEKGQSATLLDAHILLQGRNTGDKFGSEIVGLGDVDHDGTVDFAIAAIQFLDTSRPGSIRPGAVYVYSGNGFLSQPPQTQPLTTIIGRVDNNFFGMGLTPLGDLNHSGHAGLMVTSYAPGIVGGLHIFLGETLAVGGTRLMDDAVFEDTGDPMDNFAIASIATDLNKDGSLEVLVSAASASDVPGVDGPGALELITTEEVLSGSSLLQEVMRGAPGSFDTLGYALGNVGDITGDGFSEIAVGAPGVGFDGVDTAPGAVYILDGSTIFDGTTVSAPEKVATIAYPIESVAFFGMNIATANEVIP